jgi:hypothetical protein
LIEHWVDDPRPILGDGQASAQMSARQQAPLEEAGGRPAGKTAAKANLEPETGPGSCRTLCAYP